MIYIGHFSYYDEKDTKDGFCLMPLIVSAQDAEEALERFADRLQEVHTRSDLLEGAGQIYLDTLVELEEVPTDPVITQWQKIAPAEDGLCSITSALPELDDEVASAYALGGDEDEFEVDDVSELDSDDFEDLDYDIEPFLQFLPADEQ